VAAVVRLQPDHQAADTKSVPALRVPARFIPVTVLALVASGCASSTAVVRPAPFPTARPPAGLTPAPLRLPMPPGAAEVLRTAEALRGVPYRLGGDSPDRGFDCSGFVQYVFARQHIGMPRTVVEQFAVGSTVELDDVREGDLIFFSTIAPGASHVGLAVGGEAFIHAPADGGAVRIERLDAYWRERLVGIRRVL
jgi:cell wall-associated NlpC family hydrolase